MGYFDGLTAGSFKKDAEGRELFFFWGKFGKGRVIPAPEDGAYARNYLKIFYICLLLGVVPLVLFAGEAFSAQWLTVMAVFMGAALIGLAPLWLRTRTWQLSDERITIRESMTASARGHGIVSLTILVILGFLLVVSSLFVLIYTDGKVVGLLGTIFFGACLVVFLFMLRARKKA
jgi:hypothetical protein